MRPDERAPGAAPAGRGRPGQAGRCGWAGGRRTARLPQTGAGQDAICLIEVDQKVPPELLDAVRGLPYVIQVKSMKF